MLRNVANLLKLSSVHILSSNASLQMSKFNLRRANSRETNKFTEVVLAFLLQRLPMRQAALVLVFPGVLLLVFYFIQGVRMIIEFTESICEQDCPVSRATLNVSSVAIVFFSFILLLGSVFLMKTKDNFGLSFELKSLASL